MSDLFKEQYNKDLELFMSKYEGDTRLEIILSDIINKPLNKKLKYHCLIPIFLFPLSLFLGFVLFVNCLFFAGGISDGLIRGLFIISGLATILIVMCLTIALPLHYDIDVIKFFNIFKTRKRLLKRKFNFTQATPDLIQIVEKACDEDNKDIIVYELMNSYSEDWAAGTNGRLKGFYYRERKSDYEFTDKSSSMSNEIKRSLNELNSARKAWDEKQLIMSNVTMDKNNSKTKVNRKRL